MEFVKFDRLHFETYRRWFKDEAMLRNLGPEPDDSWLHFVLEDKVGQQWVIIEDQQMVGVVGLTPNPERANSWFITDFAIDPEQYSRGIGSRILAELPPFLKCSEIRAFVSINNPRALSFFKANGWSVRGEPDKDGMIPIACNTEFEIDD